MYQQGNQWNQWNQGQGTIMKEPPQVLTTKDVSYLQDALSWELLAAKKCAHWSSEAQDPAIKDALARTGQMHHRHYDLLLAQLDPNKTY